MQAELCIGQIFLFAGNFAPVGYLPCDGRLLPIPQNMALFSIIGNTYGGNGQSDFALPKLANVGHAIYIIAVNAAFPMHQ